MKPTKWKWKYNHLPFCDRNGRHLENRHRVQKPLHRSTYLTVMWSEPILNNFVIDWTVYNRKRMLEPSTQQLKIKAWQLSRNYCFFNLRADTWISSRLYHMQLHLKIFRAGTYKGEMTGSQFSKLWNRSERLFKIFFSLQLKFSLLYGARVWCIYLYITSIHGQLFLDV